MKKSIPPKPATGKGPAPTFAIEMILDGSPAKKHDAKALDHEALADIVEQANGKKLIGKPVTLGAEDLAEWPTPIAANVFRLWKALVGDSDRPVKLKVGGKDFDRPLDVAGDILIDRMTSPEGPSRALDLAAEALVISCKPEDAGIQMEAVIDRLRLQGFSAEKCSPLRSSLKQRLKGAASKSAGDGGGDGGVSPCDLARLFLAKHYGGPDGQDAGTNKKDACRLRYYDETFYRRRAGAWVEAGAEDLRLEVTSFLQEVAPKLASVRHISDVVVNTKALCVLNVDSTPPLPFHTGDKKRVMLAFENGLLDLSALAEGEDPELLPHDSAWFSTSVLPYEFDPKAKCPNFKKFLGQILDADPETLKPNKKGDNRVKVIQEMFGYVFLPDNRFQKFFALLGKGWNGKGTLLHVLQYLIGAENISSVTLEGMGKEFGQESLVGKMVNLCGDMNEIDNAKEGTLKTWTGEDLATVYRKYKEPLQVEPTIKFFYATNALPWFKDKTNGTWRRMNVVPFNYALKSDEDADPGLRRKLRKELPGILNWVLKGLARLLEQERFTACKVCAAAAEKHRDDCSPVRQFVKDHFTLASEYEGEETGLKWMTDTNAIKMLVKQENEKYGDKSISPHIVCRELAGMPGVSCKRPTKYDSRKQSGNLYFGVCIGDPKSVMPGDEDEIEAKTGVKPPPSFGGAVCTPDAATPPTDKKKSNKAGAKTAKGNKPGKK